MLAPLDGFDPVLGSDHRVVLTELRPGHDNRAALLPFMKQGGTAWMLGHSSNCC
jgi:hypothetical protein